MCAPERTDAGLDPIFMYYYYFLNILVWLAVVCVELYQKPWEKSNRMISAILIWSRAHDNILSSVKV